MAEFFGDLERLAADLYPYRWPILLGVLAVVAGITYFAYRRRWHMVVWERRRLAAIIGTPLLIVGGFIAWDLGSPLFINKTVEEEFPFAYAAAVPDDMEREDVEMVMSVMSTMDNEPLAEGMSEMMREGDGQVVKLKEGNFRDQDSFHKGSGVASVYRAPDGSHFVRLEDFRVTNGPELHVLLAGHNDPMSRSELRDGGYHDLGKLKGNIGNQNYTVPDEVNVSAQMSVVIYCKPFSVIFSVAPLVDSG